MSTLRRWDDHTIDLTAMTGRNLRSIRATNAHVAHRTRRRAIKQFLRAIVPMIRIRTR